MRKSGWECSWRQGCRKRRLSRAGDRKRTFWSRPQGRHSDDGHRDKARSYSATDRVCRVFRVSVNHPSSRPSGQATIDPVVNWGEIQFIPGTVVRIANKKPCRASPPESLTGMRGGRLVTRTPAVHFFTKVEGVPLFCVTRTPEIGLSLTSHADLWIEASGADTFIYAPIEIDNDLTAVIGREERADLFINRTAA